MNKNYWVGIILLFALVVGVIADTPRPMNRWVRYDAGDVAYGFMYNVSHTGFTVPMPSVDIYYNITMFEAGELYNMHLINNTYFNVTINGTYSLGYQISFRGGANNEYHLDIFVDDIEIEVCSTHRKLGAGGDVGSASGTCMMNLTEGNLVNLRVQDETNPANDIIIQAIEFKMVLVDGVDMRIVQEFNNYSFYFNSTVNNTFVTNNTINQTIYRDVGIWFNYTDILNNTRFAYLNDTKADSISVEQVNIEGQFINDWGQFQPAVPVAGRIEIKRISGLDEVFGYNFYQCRGTDEECDWYRNENDTNLSDIQTNITMVATPSMQRSDQTAPDENVFNKHYQEQIFYDDVDVSKEIVLPLPISANNQMLYYSTPFIYTRPYDSGIPEFQCTCEMLDSWIFLAIWDTTGGFVTCEARSVTTTQGVAICKVFYNDTNVPEQPILSKIHISTRGTEAEGVSTFDQDLLIEWNADLKANGVI